MRQCKGRQAFVSVRAWSLNEHDCLDTYTYVQRVRKYHTRYIHVFGFRAIDLLYDAYVLSWACRSEMEQRRGMMMRSISLGILHCFIYVHPGTWTGTSWSWYLMGSYGFAMTKVTSPTRCLKHCPLKVIIKQTRNRPTGTFVIILLRDNRLTLLHSANTLTSNTMFPLPSDTTTCNFALQNPSGSSGSSLNGALRHQPAGTSTSAHLQGLDNAIAVSSPPRHCTHSQRAETTRRIIAILDEALIISLDDFDEHEDE